MKFRDSLKRDFRHSEENEKILSAYDKVLKADIEAKANTTKKPESEPIGEIKNLSVPEKHQLKIAKKTLKMSDVGANIMGGMNKKEAIEFLKKIGYTDKQIKKMSEETEEQTENRLIMEAYDKVLQYEASKKLVKCSAPDCNKMVAKSKKYCQFHQKISDKLDKMSK